MNYTAFITETLKRSSSIALTHFGNVTSTIKGSDNNQVLTEADIAIGKYIVEAIQNQFPDHNIIDEEAGVIEKNAEYTWVIDPIDGTSNFTAGSPLYAIALGLLHNNTPVAGGVILPSLETLFIAEKGTGAFENDNKITVTDETSLLNCLVAYQIDGHQEKPEMTYEESKVMGELILNIRNIRSSGCIFDQLMVARGSYGGALNKTSKLWDNVALQIIVEEAGGVYTDYYGNPIDYSQATKTSDKNYTSCIGSPKLHKELQKIVKSV